MSWNTFWVCLKQTLTREGFKKHRKSCEKLPWELVGCQAVKVFLLKDVGITTSVTRGVVYESDRFCETIIKVQSGVSESDT